MSKRMHRYLAVIDPIRKRFGCNTAQLADRIGELLGFEAKNLQLMQENSLLKKDITAISEANTKLQEELEAAQAKIAELEEKLETANAKIAELESQLGEMNVIETAH